MLIVDLHAQPNLPAQLLIAMLAIQIIVPSVLPAILISHLLQIIDLAFLLLHALSQDNYLMVTPANVTQASSTMELLALHAHRTA